MNAHVVSCACGRSEVMVAPGTTVSALRCPSCPTEHPPPVLRLVKPSNRFQPNAGKPGYCRHGAALNDYCAGCSYE